MMAALFGGRKGRKKHQAEISRGEDIAEKRRISDDNMRAALQQLRLTVSSLGEDNEARKR
jgi:hypothetical protein